MIRNADEAREVVANFAYEPTGRVNFADGYLAALDGPEIKAKDAEIEALRKLRAKESL